MIRTLLLLILVSAVATVVPAQTCANLTAEIDKTYAFKPSKLTSEQIDVKSAELDKIWAMVDKAPKILLPCLKQEIDKRRSDTFFRFDAANLLIKHDKSKEAKNLLIEAYAGADLADINLRYWIPPLTAVAFEGYDVSKAGEAWLRYPNAGYDLSRHTRISKAAGALALFGSMDEAIATPALSKLVADLDEGTRHIALYLLIRQATVASDEAARNLITLIPSQYREQARNDLYNPTLIVPRVGAPKESREGFIKAMNELLDGKPESWQKHTMEVPDGERDMVVVFTESDIPIVRRVRRYYALKPTADAPEWYEVFTQIINTLRKKADSKRKVTAAR